MSAVSSRPVSSTSHRRDHATLPLVQEREEKQGGGGADEEDSESVSGAEQIPEALEFLFDTFGEEVVYVTKDLVLRDEGLTSLPHILRRFSCLERLDLSKNSLASLPCATIHDYLPNLTSLDVSDNRLCSLHNINQLGILANLRDLNLLGNPLLAVNQRSVLLGLLIFGGVRPEEAKLRELLGYSSDKKRYESSGMVIANEKPSKLLTAGLLPGNEIPTVAARVLNAKSSKVSVYVDMNPAPVPRNTRFSVLTSLNGVAITKEDLDQAAQALPSAPAKGGVGGGKEEERGGKPVKLRGRAKQEQLQKDLESMQTGRFKKKVDRTLKRLLRYDTLEPPEGLGEEEEEAEYEGEGVLQGSEWEAEALMSDVKDAVVKGKGSHEMLEGEGSGDTVGGEAWGEGEEEGNTGGGGAEVKKHRQQTCPEAWWDADKDLEVDDQFFLLPTKKDVVGQSADELSQTRDALEKAGSLFETPSEEQGPFDDMEDRLAYETAREIVYHPKRGAGGSDDPQGGRMAPGGRKTAAQRRALATQVEFADLLSRDFDKQKEADTRFLDLELPYRFRKLKVRKWMQESNQSVAVTEEIENLFTITNIESKIAAAGGRKRQGQQQTQSTSQGRKAEEMSRFRALHAKHSERLRVIGSGKWPKSEEKHKDTVKDEGGGGGKEAVRRGGGGGGGGGESVTGLTRMFDKLEKASWGATYALKGGNAAEEVVGEGVSGDIWKEEEGRVRASSAFADQDPDSGVPSRLRIEVDRILGDRTARFGAGDYSKGRRGAQQAASQKRAPNLRDVRRELDAFTNKFVRTEIEFDVTRQNVGESVDRLIAARRFGEFGARKMLIAGMNFTDT